MNEMLIPKRGKPIKDRTYVGFVKMMRCVFCEAYGWNLPAGIILPAGFTVATPPSIFHHAIMGRYSQAREDDENGMPTCDGHHKQELFSSRLYEALGIYGVHTHPLLFAEHYGNDYDFIDRVKDAVKQRHNYTPKGFKP